METAHKHRTRHEIPKGAVIMTRNEALLHQFQTVHDWKPQSEVWPLVYGRGILTGAAAFSGAHINQLFRQKLKLRGYGRFPTMAGLITGPAVTAFLFHTENLNKLLLLEVSCPLCLESKSVILHTLSAAFLPLLVAPLANFAITAGSGIYNTPYITDTKGIIKVVKSVYQPLIPKIILLFTLNALLAGFITHSQVKSMLRMQNIQYLMEQDLKDQRRASNNF